MNQSKKNLLPNDQMLDRELDCLRHTLATENTPLSVENALMKSFTQFSAARATSGHTPAHTVQKKPKPRRAGWRIEWQQVIAHALQWFAPGLGFAASVSMVAWMLLMPAHHATLQVVSAATDAPFFALQSLEQIASEPAPILIETQVPRMWLASYGIPINPETATESVRAQMLVAATGQPLALRFAE